MLIIGIDPGISGSICFFEDGKPDSTFCSTERIENWQRLLQLYPDIPSDACSWSGHNKMIIVILIILMIILTGLVRLFIGGRHNISNETLIKVNSPLQSLCLWNGLLIFKNWVYLLLVLWTALAQYRYVMEDDRECLFISLGRSGVVHEQKLVL